MDTVASQNVWDSIKPLIYIQIIFAADIVIFRTKRIESLVLAYRVVIILSVILTGVYYLIHFANENSIYESLAIVPITILNILIHGSHYRNSLVQFLKMLGQIDLKLKMNKQLYQSLKRRHVILGALFVLWLLIIFICAVKTHGRLVKCFGIIEDIKVLCCIIHIHTVQIRLDALVQCVKKRRETNTADRTSKVSLIEEIFLTKRYISSMLESEPQNMSISELIHLYRDIFKCSTLLNRTLNNDLLINLAFRFASALAFFYRTTLSASDYIYILGVFPIHTLLIMGLCLVGDKVKNAVDTLRLELAGIIAFEDLNERERREVKNFLFILEVEQVQYTVWYLFPLDLSLALSYISRITMYVILIIQVVKLVEYRF